MGAAELWDADEALRVWLDPVKLREYDLGADDVITAIGAQNATVTAGAIGDAPFVRGQQLTATVVVKGQLTSPEEFGRIVLKSKQDGSVVRVADVARVEIGRDDYSFYSRLNGRPAATVGIQLARAATRSRRRMQSAHGSRNSRTLPPGVAVEIPFDGAHFVKIAIHEVVLTLVEAVVLVFCVMWLFLRDLRYTLVPTVVIPVTLMGAFVAMWALGLSINVFTMFGLVLAIGILVDDAIVVVESVHRVMEEGVSPRDATRRAMKRIGGAIVGVTAVLTAVFVPMAFFPGSVGGIYRQFAVAMIASMLVSSFMALSLTPALCANLLKPVARHDRGAGRARQRGIGARLADRFGTAFARAETGYRRVAVFAVRRTGMVVAVYVVLVIGCGLLYWMMPGGFLPTEDQGQLQVMIQLPAGATQARTLAVVERVEAILHGEPAIANVTSVIGWSFVGSGQNVGMAFVELKDWAKRDVDAMALRDRLNGRFSAILDGDVEAALPPSVRGIGHSDGFTFRLEDRGGVGLDALKAAREQLAERAKASPLLSAVHFEDLPDAPRIGFDVDRAKAYALGVPFERIAGLRRYVRLELHQRLSGVGPDASGDHRGRSGCTRNRYAANGADGAEPHRRHGAAVGHCRAALDDRAGDAEPVQRLSVARHQRPGGDRHEFGRGDGGDGAACRCAAGRDRLRLGRCGARGAGCRAADAAARRVVGARGFHGAGRAVRKLDDSAVRADDRAARHDGCDRGGARARHAERRVFQGRDDHRGRAGGEERDPDRAIRA